MLNDESLSNICHLLGMSLLMSLIACGSQEAPVGDSPEDASSENSPLEAESLEQVEVVKNKRIRRETGEGQADSFFDLVKMPSGEVGGIGFVNGPVDGRDPGYKRDIIAVTYDGEQETIFFSDLIQEKTSEHAVQAVVTASGKFVFSGRSSQDDGSKADGTFVAKYNQNGELIWKEIEPNSVNPSLGLVGGEDETVYFAGQKEDAEKTYAFVRKYSSNGNTLWTKNLFNKGRSHIVDIARGTEGEIFVLGMRRRSVDSETGSMFIAKLRPDKTVAWKKVFDDRDAQGIALEVSSEGNIYVAGGMRHGESDSEGFVGELNSNGEFDWTTETRKEIKGDHGFSALAISSNGVYLAGSHLTESGDTDLFVARVNQQQKVTGVRYQGTPKIDKVTALHLADGSLFLTGQSQKETEGSTLPDDSSFDGLFYQFR